MPGCPLPDGPRPGAVRRKARGRLWLLAALLLVLSSAGLRPVPGRAHSSTHSALPPLSYFALTASLETALRSGARLAPGEWRVVEGLAQQESAALRRLYEQSQRRLAANDLAGAAAGRAAVTAMGYNQRVEAILYATQRRLSESLGPAGHARLEAWMQRQWPVEITLHGAPPSPPAAGRSIWRASFFAWTEAGRQHPWWGNWTRGGPAPARTRSASIFATRYDSKGVYTVALPDQCLKFANRGSHFCDDRGYIAGGDYSVIMRYKDSVGVSVGEAGPWNIDDNFWASLADPTPRRLFADLGPGMPEAQAAFYNGYNGGQDQYGRKVTAPFAIDLAFKVGDDLGLPKAKNDWITVSFLWTADWDAAPAGGGGSASSGGGVVAPVETVAAGADGSIVHPVQPGQSLWAIAVAYGTTIQAIKDLNGLGESAVIMAGQKLTVKGPGPTWTPLPTGTQAEPPDGAGTPAGTPAATPLPARQTEKAEKAARKTSTAEASMPGAANGSAVAAAGTPAAAGQLPEAPHRPAQAPPARQSGDPILLGLVLVGLLGLALFLWGSRVSRKNPD